MIFSEFAPAKVNLWLRVTGRRPDGYHTLDSLVVFADVGDVLRAEAAGELSLTLEGPFAPALANEGENLVLRAARAIAPGVGARLCLTKNLPVASGIGGGSADAAAALRVMWRMLAEAPHDSPSPALREREGPAPQAWEGEGVASATLEVAGTLGADVPVCVASRPCRMQGIGEVITPAPALPEFGLLLANPGVALETRAVFAARTGAFSIEAEPPPRFADAAQLAAAITAAGNDLAPAAITLAPAIARTLETLRTLPGALAAAMSGSGATCFALFADAATARAALPHLPSTWWAWAGAPFQGFTRTSAEADLPSASSTVMR